MSKVVYLPLDDRPCNTKYPVQIAEISDINLVSPPAELLGKKKKPANVDGLVDWLKQEADSAKFLIVSIDMLVYGGIVPSRLHRLSEAECADRLAVLKQLKEQYPALRIHAFNLIMRTPAYNNDDEEPDYYAHHGYSIFRYGWLKDKQQSGALNEAEQQEWEQIAVDVPAAHLEDFLHRRNVNSHVNELAVSLVENGIIERLIIPLDDNSEYGFSPMEQRALLIHVEAKNLMDQVLIYPGADEIGSTLFANVFCEIKNYQPEVFVRYSSTQGPHIIPKYEDRSLNESIKSHLTAAGAFIGDSSAAADFILMTNSPPVSHNNVAESPFLYRDRHRSYFSEIHIPEFVAAIEALVRKGHMIALADVASCNGADHTLMQLLTKRNLLQSIDAYAGWNTSGNTLGTVIAHAVVHSYYRNIEVSEEKMRLSRQFMIYRLIEDWGYQTIVRKDVSYNHLEQLGGNYFQVGHIQEQIDELVTAKLNQFCDQYLGDMGKEYIASLQANMPWSRMFEVNLELSFH